MSNQLQEIYDNLPEIDCKGKCQESCGPISYFGPEIKNMRNHGVLIPPEPTSDLTCNKLNELTGECTIYESRPVICRLFGIVEGMKCPHGCIPEEGYLSDDQAFQIMQKIKNLGY